MKTFITGLPYAGKDILKNLLEQNPNLKFYENTPLFHLTNSIINETHAQGGYTTQCDDNLRLNIIKGLFTTYYGNDISFDVDYRWTYITPIIEQINGKIIILVRDIKDVLNEYEYEYFKNPTNKPYIGNVYSRCNDHMQGQLGDAYTAIKQVLNYRSTNIMIVEYEWLIEHPDEVLKNIYHFLKLEPFTHNIDFTIERSPMILPPDLINQYSNMELWRNAA